jgi:SAM-dependent methyltransferase
VSYAAELPEMTPEPRNDAVCRACDRALLETFAASSDVPVNNARVFADPTAARAVPRGAIELALCRGCGFIENVRFDQALVTYDSGYEEQQSYSPTFNAFADGLASDLVERWGLRRKRIVEIGCGKGDFLSKLCELGENHGVGLDPTIAPGRLNDAAAQRVTLRPEFYGSRTGGLIADAVICRHTLEHIPDVRSFVRTLRRSLSSSPGARVYFEVPDVARVLRDAAFWDVYYEHCSYFTEESLARLFRIEDFVVDDVRLGFDGQYVLLEAHVPYVGERIAGGNPYDEPGDIVALAHGYAERVRTMADGWGKRVRSARARGEHVAVWGSGSKCVAFLSETGLEDDIEAVVDVNPHRQGRCLPITATPVRPPAYLTAVRPDLVVVMNAAYVAEIRAMLAEMNLYPRVEAVG